MRRSPLREGARVGTSALRRRAQLLAARPDLEVVELRGNVDTRLAKRAAGEVDALSSPPRGSTGSAAAREAGALLHDGVFVPAAGPGRDRRPGPHGLAGGRGRGAADHAPTHAALDDERARRARAGAPPATRRSACSPLDGVVRAFVGLPDGSVYLLEEAATGAELRRAALLAAGRRRAAAEAELAPMTVFLVGAGPGDPGLMTVRARELIAAADVILYDRLIPPGALDGARADAELVYVGKSGGGPQMPQEEIDRLLVQYGTGERTVVRLKGGDPFVFGRGGEEALVLREAGIPFEVVPGVTAGIAAPAYAGIPVTHRELACGVAFVTGHEDRHPRPLSIGPRWPRSRARSSSTWA